mgnify:CR=1 FL=1
MITVKVLIADDEDYAREGIIETVDWERFEIDEIMQAVNGAEAVKIARWFKPDIVISDIRMPQVNGIEFAEKVREMNPDSRIIFISGYMEIEYLKSAIQLGAINYIEKPVDQKVLEETIGKAVEEARRINRGKADAQERRELQQQKLFRLLTERDADEKTLEKLFAETDILKKTMCFQCVAAMSRTAPDHVEEHLEQISQFLRSSGVGVISVYHPEKQQYEFVISYEKKEQYRLMPLYHRLLEKMPELCIGVGIEANNCHNVYNSYRTADAALNRAFYNTKDRLFTIDESITGKRFISPGVYGEFLQVMNRPAAEMKKWCGGLFDKMYQQQYYRKEQVYTLMTSLLSALYQKYPFLTDAYPSIQNEDDISSCVMNMKSLGEIKGLFDTVLDEIGVHQQEQSGYSRIVGGIMDYIEMHYGEESLSVTEIAEQFHFSSAYLNVLFRQEVKVTLKQYLNNYRLERAKRMLEQDYDKITEIAEKCGYANSNYFAKVFKAAMGMTPLEYRSRKGGHDEKQ